MQKWSKEMPDYSTSIAGKAKSRHVSGEEEDEDDDENDETGSVQSAFSSSSRMTSASASSKLSLGGRKKRGNGINRFVIYKPINPPATQPQGGTTQTGTTQHPPTQPAGQASQASTQTHQASGKKRNRKGRRNKTRRQPAVETPEGEWEITKENTKEMMKRAIAYAIVNNKEALKDMKTETYKLVDQIIKDGITTFITTPSTKLYNSALNSINEWQKTLKESLKKLYPEVLNMADLAPNLTKVTPKVFDEKMTKFGFYPNQYNALLASRLIRFVLVILRKYHQKLNAPIITKEKLKAQKAKNVHEFLIQTDEDYKNISHKLDFIDPWLAVIYTAEKVKNAQAPGTDHWKDNEFARRVLDQVKKTTGKADSKQGDQSASASVVGDSDSDES